MGSDLTVKTEVGCGTIFAFDLRVGVVEAAEVQSQPPARRVVVLNLVNRIIVC